MSWDCVCGFTTEKHPELRAHHRECVLWKAQLGRCPECRRKHYRHTKDCSSAGEDKRQKLIRKHGLDPEQFEEFLKALERRYRALVKIHLG
jgi:hypothetical protein